MTKIIYPEELQDGYNVCPMCNFGKASVYSEEATNKTWFNTAVPAHLKITCMGCHHETLCEPGSIKLTGLYIGAGT